MRSFREKIAAFVILLVATPLLAQNVSVISGEHSTFSRIVLTPPQPTSWRVERVGTEAKILFQASDWIVDTSQIFDLIPRVRVSEVEWIGRESALLLRLACDCTLEVFEFRATSIVIDVKDESSFSSPIEPIQSTPGLPVGFDELVTSFDITSESEQAALQAVGLQETETVLGAEQRSLKEFEAQLLKQLSQAAGEGIILPEVQSPSLPQSSQQSTVPDNIRFRTAFTSDQNESVSETEELSCLPSDFVDLKGWIGDSRPLEKIAVARQALSPSVGAVSIDQTILAARSMVSAGFGLEAIVLLKSIPKKSIEVRILRALASAIDNPQEVNESSELTGYAACPGPGLIWAALTSPKEVKAVSASELAESFNALPSHIKGHISPALINGLLDNGHSEAALLLRTLVPATEAIPSPALNLVDAKIARLKDRNVEAERLLDQAKETNTSDARVAVFSKLEAILDDGGVPTPEDVQLASSFAYEMSGSDEGRIMQILVGRSKAALNDFDEAWSEFISADAGAPYEIREKVGVAMQEALLMASARSSDSEFLRVYSKWRDRIPDLARADAMIIAGRLFEISAISSAAEEVSAFLDQSREEDALLVARVLLSTGSTSHALRLLAEYEGQAVSRLRADTLAELGEFETARQIYGSLGEEDLALTMSVLAGSVRFADLVVGDSDSFAGESSTEDLSLPIPPQTPTLRGARELLETTNARKAAVEQILAPE